MANLLVVFGATGQQGGSIINAALNDRSLSKLFSIRGITRDPNKPGAAALRTKGVEVVVCDLDDAASIKAAVHGASTVFAMTRGIYDENAKSREVTQGKAIVEAAVDARVGYIIWSTACSCNRLSGGKYLVAFYDSHAEVEKYRGMPIRSAFFAPGIFLQNFATSMRPHKAQNGSFEISGLNSAETKFPVVDIVADTGKYVAAIMTDPDKSEGQIFTGASEEIALHDIVRRMSK